MPPFHALRPALLTPVKGRRLLHQGFKGVAIKGLTFWRGVPYRQSRR